MTNINHIDFDKNWKEISFISSSIHKCFILLLILLPVEELVEIEGEDGTLKLLLLIIIWFKGFIIFSFSLILLLLLLL